MRLLAVYFDYCYRLFRSREQQIGPGCDYFVSIGGRFTIRIKFAGRHLVEPFSRAMSHIEAEPVDSPDLTICVWDSRSAADTMPPHPYWERDQPNPPYMRSAQVRLACEYHPNRMSLLAADRDLGLFWIEDGSEVSVYEQCRPLRNIIHWWGLGKQLYLAHAAFVGTAEAGVLIVGKPGAGKSTSALSCLSSDLYYGSDDLCLIGCQDGKVWAYSLYNSGKLESLRQLPHLSPHVWNLEPARSEKAVVFVQEGFPGKMIAQVPISAILVPSITGLQESSLTPLKRDEALRTLVSSSVRELIGPGLEDFLGLYKVCSSLPSYTFRCGTDLSKLNQEVIALLSRQAVSS